MKQPIDPLETRNFILNKSWDAITQATHLRFKHKFTITQMGFGLELETLDKNLKKAETLYDLFLKSNDDGHGKIADDLISSIKSLGEVFNRIGSLISTEVRKMNMKNTNQLN